MRFSWCLDWPLQATNDEWWNIVLGGNGLQRRLPLEIDHEQRAQQILHADLKPIATSLLPYTIFAVVMVATLAALVWAIWNIAHHS